MTAVTRGDADPNKNGTLNGRIHEIFDPLFSNRSIKYKSKNSLKFFFDFALVFYKEETLLFVINKIK